MVDTLDLNKNTATVPNGNIEDRNRESEAAHHHMEQEAMKAAKRAGERMSKDEAGNDIISK
jgi:hypothetical protein